MVKSIGNIDFVSEYDNGNSGTSFNIDWNNGNHQKITLTGNVTLTFTNPSGIGMRTLKIVQDATGSRTITWPTIVKWAGGVAPTITTTANGYDMIAFRFDGSFYDALEALDFN